YRNQIRLNKVRGLSIWKDLYRYIKLSDEAVDPFQVKLPWLTFESIRLINLLLHKESKVFEFGAGASTFFFAGVAEKVYSVEHNESWYEKICKQIESNNYFNINISLEQPFHCDSTNKNIYKSST